MDNLTEKQCYCPCHSIDIPHEVICPDCRPLPISWYPCSFCGAKKHSCCQSAISGRQYPMGWFHQHRKLVARSLNARRGLGKEENASG